MRGLLLTAMLTLGAPGCASATHPQPISSLPVPGEETAVATTVTGVAHHIDHKSWPELRQLFADGVRTDYTSLFGGTPQDQSGDSLIEAWKKLLTPVVTQHLLGPISVDVDVNGAKAVARCHVRGYHYVKGAPGGDEWTVAGHYVFELVKAGSSWRIAALKLETFYQTGNLELLAVAGGK